MTDFNLKQAVSDALDSSSLASPDEIAHKVAEGIGPREVRSALLQALPNYVSRVIQQRRSVNVILDPSQATEERETARKQSARSFKVGAIRSAWQRALMDRVHVHDGYKLFGECTYEDLVFAAEERRDHARRNAAKAEQYSAVAAKLQAFGVATVAELPEGDSDVLAVAA